VATSVTFYVLIPRSVHHNIQTVHHHNNASSMLCDGGTGRWFNSLFVQRFTQTGEQEKMSELSMNKQYCAFHSYLIWPWSLLSPFTLACLVPFFKSQTSVW